MTSRIDWAVALLLMANPVRAQVVSRTYRINQLIKQNTYRIHASNCADGGPSRVLTGFLLESVGLVTAAHGVAGCQVTGSAASGGDAQPLELAMVSLKRDLV